MFTLTVQDEQVYRRLLEKVAQRGESLDDVLRELLDQGEQAVPRVEETPAQKLLRLIDAADLPFERAFDAREAEDLLSREAGAPDWRSANDDHDSA